MLISHRSIKMNSELEQLEQLEKVVDLLQEYVIRLQAAAPLQKPIIKLETKAIESIESIQVNKKHLFEEKQEKQETHNDNSKSYLFHVTREKDKLFWAFYIMLNGEDA